MRPTRLMLCSAVVILTACGGGSAPANNTPAPTPPVVTTPPEPVPYFASESLTVDLTAYPVVQECHNQVNLDADGPIISEMVFPVAINDDNYVDFMVLYHCPTDPGYFGITHDEPPKTLVIPYLSDTNGNFSAKPQEVFGKAYPQFDQMPRKYVLEDVNGDGRTDIGLAINRDDGRYNQESEYQLVLLSQPNNTYSMERIDTQFHMMSHSINKAKNELSSYDILWGGYCCTADVAAFRYVDGAWEDVSHKYPNTSYIDLVGLGNDWGTEFNVNNTAEGQAMAMLGHRNGEIDVIPAKGMNLWVMENDTWRLNDTFLVESAGVGQFISWGDGQPYTLPIWNIDGRELLVDVFTQQSCMMQHNNKAIFVAQVGGRGQEDGSDFDRDIAYGDDNIALEFVNYLRFYDVTDNTFQDAGLSVANEQNNSVGNYFDCMDVNNDGHTDIVMHSFVNSWRDNWTKTQTPVVYLNNGDSQFEYIDYEGEDTISNNYDEYYGKLWDIDGDGLMDLIRIPVRSGAEGDTLDQKIHIHLAQKGLGQ